MTRTILISITAFFLIASAWTVNLVTYHQVDQGLNPLSPVTPDAWAKSAASRRSEVSR